MSRPCKPPVTSRQIAWLLGLLLLLPLAQVAAQWHLTSHLHVKVVQDHPLLTQDQCDLCLTALQVTTGGPQVQVEPPARWRLVFDTPVFLAPQVHTPTVWPPYASRAPPGL